MPNVRLRLFCAGAVLAAGTLSAVAAPAVPPALAAPASVMPINDDIDTRRDDRSGGTVVDAPGAYVDTRGPVEVDAPAAHVEVGRGSVHVEAPFVNLRIPR
jgi:hypothetical protein